MKRNRGRKPKWIRQREREGGRERGVREEKVRKRVVYIKYKNDASISTD